jgi:nicotinamidase-related amidase
LATSQRGRRGSEPATEPEIYRGFGPSVRRPDLFRSHHRWEPGDYTHWKHANPRQLAGAKNQIFAKGTWGGEWHPDFVPQEGDIIIKEHWAQSGFANTDLDQQLKQHGIEKIIIIGMLANTCIESTGRFGMELGYHVTLLH